MRKSTLVILSAALLLLAAVICTAGCVSEDTADTIFYGNVITMDDNNPTAEAVAVKDGIIVFVGTEADAEAFIGEKTKIIDYGYYSIYPGFLEAHNHVGLAGMRDYGMAKLSSGVPLEENVKEIQKYIQDNPGKDCYIGSGWFFTGEEPTAAMLDAVCPDVPVILQTLDAHAAWVNSKELEILNYSPEYIKEMGPQQIHVDANGKPTGFLEEVPAISLSKNFPYTVEDLKEFTLKWQDRMLSLGYTGVADAGVELFGDKALQAFDELSKEGKLKMRIYGLSMVNDNTDTPDEDMAKIYELAKKVNTEYFKIIGAKVFLDGIVPTHTAWMLEPYKDMPESTGVKRFSDTDKLARLITAADKYGMLVHAHTLGDGAAHTFADAVEKSVKETGNYDQRNAAAHLQFITEEDKKRFGTYGIVAVTGYLWSPPSPATVLEGAAVGADRIPDGFPAKSFIDYGAVVVGHTDYPVSPAISIPEAVYSGVTREEPFGMFGARNPEKEALTREEVLSTLTKNVAYMWHEEDRMGTLEKGKIANMAVLAVDFLHDDMEDIAQATLRKNVATIVDGTIIYEADPVKLSEEEAEAFKRTIINLTETWLQREDVM